MRFLWQCMLRLTFSSMWCCLVDWYQCVGGISCLHLQGGRCEEGDSRLIGNIESYLLGYYFFRDRNILKDTEEISRYL